MLPIGSSSKAFVEAPLAVSQILPAYPVTECSMAQADNHAHSRGLLWASSQMHLQ